MWRLFDLVVDLAGVRLETETVRWSSDVLPNRCVSINGVNAQMRRLWGWLPATVQTIPVFLDDRYRLYYNLQLVPEGDDSRNWINGELYALCVESAATRVNVAVSIRALERVGR